MKHRFFLSGFLLLLIMFSLNGEPYVKAVINGNEFHQGDIIKVLISLDSVENYHGLYFDLNYDDSIVAFEGIREGSLIKRIPGESKLSYAYSDSEMSETLAPHVIASFSLQGADRETSENGILSELRFRVISNIMTQDCRFTFNDCGVLTKENAPVPDVNWIDSDPFDISVAAPLEFIMIKEPFDSQVFYDDQISASLICSEGEYVVRFSSDQHSNLYVEFPVSDGRMINADLSQLPLVPGFNVIKAELLKENLDGGMVNLQVYDEVKVFRADDSRFVKILSPADHSLLNTDMVDISVSSPFPYVEINGVIAEKTGEYSGDSSIYHARLWLKRGFNTITAEATDDSGSGRVKYTDSIQVYYQKDDSVFRFVQPQSDEVLKPSSYTNLLIKGEIDSPYKSVEDQGGSGPEQNSVTLRVFYMPKNNLLSSYYLVKDEQAKIIENDYSYNNAKSKYIFYNDFPITLSNLEDGELIIYAYKNKKGSSYDDLISRVIHIDNQRLWIDLVQPNVFATDHLDNQLRIMDYNENKVIDPDHDIELSSEGSIQLAMGDKVVADTGLSDISDMISLPNGSLLGVTNTANGLLKILQKKANENSWSTLISRPGMYGYDLCYTDLGVFIGVSNLYSTSNSGLYLLSGTDLINISLPEYIPHVQFINWLDNKVFLYGNNYEYLYSFDLYTLEEDEGKLVVHSLEKDYFPNNLNLKQFFLSKNRDFSILRNEGNQVLLYRKSSQGYLNVTAPLDGLRTPVSGKSIVLGEYSSGDYDTAVVLKSPGELEVIMISKNSGKLIRNTVSPIDFDMPGDSVILGVGFYKDNFYLSCKNQEGYFLRKGQIFFKRFLPDPYDPVNIYTPQIPGLDILYTSQVLFVPDPNQIFLGIRSHLVPGSKEDKVYTFKKNLVNQGACDFNYVNDDIDGLQGFEFEVNPRWVAQNDTIFFGFKIKEKSGLMTGDEDKVIFSREIIDLKNLVEMVAAEDSGIYSTDYYKITNRYDADKGHYILYIEFKELQEKKYLSFHFALKSENTISPVISGLKVYKKVKAKIAAVPGEEVVLPIHGYVYDRTVKEVDIQHNTIPLGWDGSFYLNYKLKTEKNMIPIEISCVNAIGEKAVINFNVEIVESYNNVWDLQWSPGEEGLYSGLTLTADDFIIDTDDDSIRVGGKFYGLKGCVVGYELQGYNPGTDSYELLERGLFDITEDNSVKDGLSFRLGSEYIAGTFFDEEIPLFPGEQKLFIYCENPGGKRTDFGRWRTSFEKEVVPLSINPLPSLSAIQLIPGIDNNTLSISAGFTGDADCVIGYRFYGADMEELIESGLLDKENLSANADYVSGIADSSNIEIPCEANKIVLFCNNPGSSTREYHYTLQKLFPSVVYNIPDDQQSIVFDLGDEERIEKTVEDIKITHQKILKAFESPGPDYRFTREYEIQGRIDALFTFNDLLIKNIPFPASSGSSLSFSNGESEMIIPVGAGNLFSFRFTVTLGKDSLSEKFYIAAIPTMPFKNELKRGIELIVNKDFEDTDYRMDFTSMRPDNWSESDVGAGKIPFRFRFNREDVPLDKHIKAEFMLNYIHNFKGYVDHLESGVYCLKDEITDEEISFSLDQLRINSMNRLQWHLEYKDSLANNICVVSSSVSGKMGMQDFVFEYIKESETLPTEISFSSGFNDTYYDTSSNPLPDINLTRDKLTQFSLFINNKLFEINWNEEGQGASYSGNLYELGASVIEEGKNFLKIVYKEQGESPHRLDRAFLFDSKAPFAAIESYDIQREATHEDYLKLLSLSASVEEANFSKAYLYFDNNIIGFEPEVEIMGKAHYRIHWKALSEYNIVPSESRIVKVEVLDHSGKTVFSEPFTGLLDINRPDESFVAEDYFDLPVYDTDNMSVYVGNEDGYKGRPFSQHTKFAPLNFLPKLNIYNSLTALGNVLFKNTRDTEPFNTALTVGEGAGKFLVIKIAKDPANSIYELEDIKGKINFNVSGFKRLSISEFENFPPQPLTLEENKDCIYVEGFNYLYYIVLVYQDSVTPINEQTAGIKGAFYEQVKNLMSQVREEEVFGEARVTISFDSNWSPSLGKDIFITGNDDSVFKDIIMYDSNYEDPENYRVDVSGLLQEKELNLIKNGRGREQEITSINPVDDAGFGTSVNLHQTLAIVGAPKDLSSSGELSGAAYIYSKGINGDWDLDSEVKLDSGDGEAGDHYGFSVDIWGNTAIVGAPGDSVDGIASGSVYFYTLSDQGLWEESIRFKGAFEGERFGHSVVLSGPYAIVGAPFHRVNGRITGGVYVYKKLDSRTWTFMTRLLPEDLDLPGHLGVSLALQGRTILAGNNWEEGTDSGSIYVFEENSSGIWLQKEIIHSPESGNTGFGLSVDLSDEQAIAGAPLDDSDAVNGGVAYVLERNEEGLWNFVYTIHPLESSDEAYFGRSVAISEDYAAAGAPKESGGRGGLYVYQKMESLWVERYQFFMPDGDRGDFFGKSLSMSGDSILCGGPYNYLEGDEISGTDLSPGVNKPGSVFFYSKSSNRERWGEQNYQKLTLSDPLEYDLFGQAAAVSGNYAFVGAYGDDDAGSDSGSVAVYEKNALGKWGLTQKLVPSDAAGDDLFGFSISLSGDRAIIGSPYDDTARGRDSGSVVLFEKDAGGLWQERTKLIPGDGSANDRFGYSVAIDGNYAAVGAYCADEAGSNSGKVYVYERNAAGSWIPVARLLPSDGEADDYFGQSVSLSGSLLVVGAPGVDEFAPDMGRAYVYRRTGAGTWLFEAGLNPFDGLAGDSFGTSVAVSGHFVLIGAPGYDDGSLDNGKVYAFRQTTGGIWIGVSQLSAESSTEGRFFGCSISMLGDQAIIGAYDGNDFSNSLSTAYIFERDNSDIWEKLTRVIVGGGESDFDIFPSVGISDQDFIIGVPYEATRAGAAYVHSLTEVLLFNDSSSQNYHDVFIFNYDPEDDPFADSIDLLPENLTEYLIFKIKRSSENPVINTIEDIDGHINFVFTSSGYNYIAGEKENYSAPVSLSEGAHYFCETRDDDLFYVINRQGIDSLKAQFESEIGRNVLFNRIGSVKIYDRGSLRLQFTGPLSHYQGIELFTAVHGREEIGAERVVDFDHYFYDQGSTEYQSDDYLNLHPALRYTFEERSITHPIDVSDNPGIPGMTFNFWLRIEDEGQSMKESVYTNTPRRVFTVSSNTGEEIFHLQYKYNMLELYRDETPLNLDPNESIYGPVFTEPLDKDDWFMLSLMVHKENRSLVCYIDGKPLKEFNIGGEVVDQILSQGAVYSFGPRDEDSYNTGFYSIAKASYIYEVLTTFQLLRLFELNEFSPDRVIEYVFRGINGVLDRDTYGASDRDSDLYVYGGDDYYVHNQNSDFSESPEDGSFKGSGKHENFLVTRDGVGGEYVVLQGNNVNTYYYNLEVFPGVDVFNPNPLGEQKGFRLEPGNRTGRFYFGNKQTNYGLGQDRWYSVSGYVESMEEGQLAEMVLVINNREQRMTLEEGGFHFVYDNYNHLIPSDVKLYIETSGTITLRNDIVFNEGNYILPGDVDQTSGSTFFAFDLSGTVHFRYKPMMVNKDGFVDYPVDLAGKPGYQEMTLFDSEFIKIGVKEHPLHGENYYYLALKSTSDGYIEDGNFIWTNQRVKAGWQHLQVSYDLQRGVCYFYIDGALAGVKENLLIMPFGSIQGDSIPRSDNVWLGSNKEKTSFAEGYLDHLYISKFYENRKYVDKKPVNINYNPQTLSIEMTSGAVSHTLVDPASLIHQLECLDDGKIRVFNTKTIDLSGDSGGRYRLVSSMMINGHKYDSNLTFNITEKPRFDLKFYTPMVFAGERKDLDFRFVFDHAYRLEDQDLVYAGVRVRAEYDGQGSPAVAYLVQDFINQDKTKWKAGHFAEGSIVWVDSEKSSNGELSLSIPSVQTSSDINCTVEYFYFKDAFKEPADHSGGEDIVIPVANMEETEYIADSNDLNYKIQVPLSGNAITGPSSFTEKIVIDYEISDPETGIVKEGTTSLIYHLEKEKWIIELYFDDILPSYGEYFCNLFLKYNGIRYVEKRNIPIEWKKLEESKITAESFMNIQDFSLLFMDKEENIVNLYLAYEGKNVASFLSDQWEGDLIEYTLYVKQGNQIFNEQVYTGVLSTITGVMIFNNIAIPKEESSVKLTLKAASSIDNNIQYIRTREVELLNTINAPEVLLSNSVDSLITYNNVYFSWKGFYDGTFNQDIAYTYNLDGTGWITPNNEWRSVRFFELAEGYHRFEVKALYNGLESAVRSVSFFVDVNKPQFNKDKITVEKLYDTEQVFYAVTILGEEGAIDDISLRDVYINGEPITLGTKGSFEAMNLPVYIDGTNTFTITAKDKVGNYSDLEVFVENPVTSVLFPLVDKNVRYSPLTVVGKINEEINTGMEIFVRDPYCSVDDARDYSGWKKAVIHADRTFFVENVFVNPGSFDKELTTDLIMRSVFASGKVFEKVITVKANEIIMPIEMNLSTHAAEGERGDTYVEIDCYANVENISSWSVDFTGDGIYDVIDLVDNPDSDEARSHFWNHKYASMGKVNPRVRVVTTDGNFFSVSDTLIIHERIRQASHKMIDKPISLDKIRMPDNSERVFVLKEEISGPSVVVYEIGRNEAYISNKLFDINLSALGIANAVVLRVLNHDHLFVASNNTHGSILYEIAANQFGNYTIAKEVVLPSLVREMTLDDQDLYLSFIDNNYIISFSLDETGLDENSMVSEVPVVRGSQALDRNSGLAVDPLGLLVADFYNQRLIRFSKNMNVLEQIGSFGVGEKEFLKPSIVKSFENRIFLYDESRKDIQVFDSNFSSVCVLRYHIDRDEYNYLEPEFFENIVDMEIVAREENRGLFYYALLLSGSSNKLAMLRLPHWEELRAKVRNNKVVFIKSGEVYTAKPDGSDLQKILSSDSLPRIEGKIAYPSLAPDGMSLLFTSKMRLYSGESYGYISDENIHAYDNLFLVNLETRKISRIDLGLLNNFELERPVFNYNGDKVIFSAKETSGNWQIYVYDLAEKIVSKLFDSDENTRFPYYSPDDRFVVFTTDYDGDEDIAIIDVANPHIRYYITDNECRDSFPVWSRVYPLELVNPNAVDPEMEKVKTKIAFVSERDYHKGLYTSYIKHLSDEEIQVFDIREKQIQNQDPDKAAIAISPGELEGDYPCFTGDGRSLLFEYFDGQQDSIKKFDFVGIDFDDHQEPGDINRDELIKEEPEFVFEDVELMRGATRPAGMKNTITNFTAELQNGNEVSLEWNRYTENDIFYTIQYNSKSENPEQGEKKIFGKTFSTIYGLTLGVDYFIRVCIIENGEEVATSQWIEVRMPKVVAKPVYEIDRDNPYLVKFTAWQPEFVSGWDFDWMVDNTSIPMDNCNEFYYEFATSGMKTVLLKVSDKSESDLSEPMKINIVSDIEPVIEYILADDSSYIELNAENSRGNKIDLNSAVWTISGPDRDPVAMTGSRIIAPLNGFTEKINVNLSLRRIGVNNQSATDVKYKNITIDLDFKALKPVITYGANPLDRLLVKFSGEHSLGNIDWYRSSWTIFADNQQLYQVDGKSAFEYKFPETNTDTVYSVVLSVPRKNDGLTETVSKIVYMEAQPLEPVIDYELLTMKKGGEIIGYKLLLDATGSRGNGIDFNATRWSVPMPNAAEGQVVQIGPTAIYNLLDIEEGIVIETALTLFRRNGEAKTVSRFINIRAGEFPKMRLVVNQNVQETESGRAVSLDILQSTGPNIIWDKTEWLIDAQYKKQGAVVRIDIPAGDEDRIIPYTCTLFRGGTEPEIHYGNIEALKNKITPVIATSRLSSKENNYYELDVLQSEGMNIDWERTEWFIYDGNENVTRIRGSKITHAFVISEEKMGYQVMVTMYHKGGSQPFVGYKNIDIDGNELIPVIQWDVSEEDPNAYVFSCENSTGANIDWTQTKWTFLDTTESKYGTTVTHKFPVDSEARTYAVSLTLFRRTGNNQIETKTVTKQVKIGSNEIIPVVTARVYGDYLVLSAEDSHGRGLLLDRSVWLFPGKGDNTSYSSKIQGGVITRGNLSIAGNQYLKTNLNLYTQSQVGSEFEIGSSVFGTGVTLHTGGPNGIFFKTGVATSVDTGSSMQTNESAGMDVVDYSGYTDDTDSFSSSNIHTGAVCRRNVAGQTSAIVTLYVYRVEQDGKMTGTSVTVKVELEEARAQASSGGVKYE